MKSNIIFAGSFLGKAEKIKIVTMFNCISKNHKFLESSLKLTFIKKNCTYLPEKVYLTKLVFSIFTIFSKLSDKKLFTILYRREFIDYTFSNSKLSKCMFKIKFILGYKYAINIIEKTIKTNKNALFLIWGDRLSTKLILGQKLKENNVKHFYFEYGEIPGYFFVSKKGMFSRSIFVENWNKKSDIIFKDDEIIRVQNIINNILKKQITNKIYAINKLDKLDKLDETKKTIYVNGCELFAMGTIYKDYANGSDFLTNTDLLYYISCNFSTSHNIIYKEHPNTEINHPKLCVKETDFKSVVFVRDINIHQVLKISDFVITFPSKVSILSLIHKKPVFVLGNFTIPETVEEIGYFTSNNINDISMVMNSTKFNEKKFNEILLKLESYLINYSNIQNINSECCKLKHFLEVI